MKISDRANENVTCYDVNQKKKKVTKKVTLSFLKKFCALNKGK